MSWINLGVAPPGWHQCLEHRRKTKFPKEAIAVLKSERKKQRIFIFLRKRHRKYHIVVEAPFDLRIRSLVKILVHEGQRGYSHELEGQGLRERVGAHEVALEDTISRDG